MCLLRGYVLYEKYIRVHTTCQYPKKDSSPYRRGQAFNTCRAARQSRLLQPLLSLFKFHRHIDAQREAYTQKTNRSRTPGQPGRLLSDGGGTRLHAATKLRVNTRSQVHSCAIPFEKPRAVRTARGFHTSRSFSVRRNPSREGRGPSLAASRGMAQDSNLFEPEGARPPLECHTTTPRGEGSPIPQPVGVWRASGPHPCSRARADWGPSPGSAPT